MPEYVSHPRIKPDTLESRFYQESILSQSLDQNLLCVLPTGLGKTNIAVMLTVLRLEKHPESKALILAPTRPLVNQHFRTFIKFIDYNKKDFFVLTGLVGPDVRKQAYEIKRIIFATPQTVQNDLMEHGLSLKDFSLLVMDEAHHAIGGYAYPYIAKTYMKQSDYPRILGLTASPGGTSSKIKEICSNLLIDSVEIRTEEDSDVSPHVKEKDVEWIHVDLPESFLKIKEEASKFYNKKIDSLKRMGFIKTNYVSKTLLLSLQTNLAKSARQGYKKSFMGMSLVAQIIKINHALDLLETQGISILENYWKKLRQQEMEGNKAAKKIINDKNVSNAMFMTHQLFQAGSKHPKISKLCTIVDQQFKKDPESMIIVFANFRDAVNEIVSVLRTVPNARPIEFIGQREGMTQKEQIKTIVDFKDGIHNVLVCTSVGEEGIDIPEMELAVFYEPVPSEIRSIQRRGRVGRSKVG
ncbi:MAG: DEAD/DEAH box helicase [Candidatus Aenigmatarchaeota archaeon]